METSPLAAHHSGRLRPSQAEGNQPLSVLPDGMRAGDVLFRLEAGPKRLGGALGLSIVSHTVGFVLVILIASHLPEQRLTATLSELAPSHLIWIPPADPGGGGNGGAVKKSLEFPRVKEAPKVSPPIVEDKPESQPEPNLPALPISADETVPEILGGLPTLSGGSLGIGTGSGEGSGLGSGSGPGSGEGVYRPGPGIRVPIPIREVRPRYTVEAMRAKMEGSVLLEAVVLADGTVGEIHIVRSLDPSFGLDEEAVNAVRQWRFSPGTRFGEPVAVRVSLTLTFTLR